ncbi:MAG: TIGR02466 family protein [Kiloniellales bacterium]|nr:TIGR02466 family protein [Kiloniellales bacterium]
MAQQGRAFANTQLLQLFPTCVWLHDLKPEDHEPLNRRIAPVIKELVADKRPSLASLTWQTHHDLHHHEAFTELTAFARKAAQGVLDHLQIDYGDFQITGCWANVNPQRTQHRAHTHPNNLLSGVYYVQVPDGRDGLVFHEPRPQALVISPKVKKLSALTGSEAKVEVREGRLVIFPSWLQHSVASTRAEGERISVSFNFMLSSYAEDFSPPRWSNR